MQQLTAACYIEKSTRGDFFFCHVRILTKLPQNAILRLPENQNKHCPILSITPSLIVFMELRFFRYIMSMSIQRAQNIS